MGNQKKKRTESRIFSDHKKVGKTLVPPMRQYLGERGMVSWVDRILPELIWLAVIIENLGVRRGVEISAKIAKLANTIKSEEYFAFASSFNLLDTEQKQSLVQLLEDANYLDEVRNSLRSLLHLYPECPLKFLDENSEQLIETQTISHFKETLAKYYNRRAQPAMIIQANVVYFAGICGKLRYSSNVQVPNLEAIISDFESNESKRACASVRATVNAFIGRLSEKISDYWPRYFWNRGIEIDPSTSISRESRKLEIDLPEQIIRFIELADLGLEERWSKLPKDIYENHQCEVIGALLARQITLAKRMARTPAFWDVHIGPILLRVMIDNHITLAWILKDPAVRSKHFVLHGLGQAKLYLEHLKVENEDGSNPDLQQLIEAMERWINNQQYSFLTNVNLGSWSGLNTREMAEEADCLDLYRYAYLPFSSCIHNMWNHVGRLNVVQSGNPLHKYLLVPCDPEIEPELDLLINCAKYLQESFRIVDETFNLQCNTLLPYDYWLNQTDQEPTEPTSEKGESSGS
jgi:hypothetical protein